MGGRGTFASGNSAAYSYETLEKIAGVKVLKGINGKHSLPEEAHSSWAYIKLKPNGTFHEMRIYDKDHYLVKEIAYHGEYKLTGKYDQKVLHIHNYDRNFIRTEARLLTKAECRKYKKYFKGVPEQ